MIDCGDFLSPRYCFRFCSSLPAPNQTKQSSARATTAGESASLQRTRMSIVRSAIPVITVQQWSVIFINQHARGIAEQAAKAHGKANRHLIISAIPKKMSDALGHSTSVCDHCTAMAGDFYQASATGDSTRTTQQTRLGVYPKSNGVILQTATPMHFLNMSQFS